MCASRLKIAKLAATMSTLSVLCMCSHLTYADDTDTFMPYVSGAYAYDSNLFRLPNDQAATAILGTADTSDSYTKIAVGIDMNLKISRQTIRAHSEVNQTRFQKYSALDYTGRNSNVSWDWLAGEALTGDLGIIETLTQASYANVKQPIQNLVRTRTTFFNAALGTDSAFQYKLGLERTNIDNEAITQALQDADISFFKLGVEYATKTGSKVELMSRRSHAKYPNRQLVSTAAIDNGYRQWDNGLAGTWMATGKTQVTGVLNHTQRSYQDIPQRDFTGLTGLLSANWAVTDISGLRLSLHRDIGAIDSDTASYAVNRGMTLGVNWRPSAKLTFNAQFSRDKISYRGEPQVALNLAPVREDRLTILQASLTYAVLRNTTIGLSVQKGQRESNEALSGYRYSQALVTFRSQF